MKVNDRGDSGAGLNYGFCIQLEENKSHTASR